MKKRTLHISLLLVFGVFLTGALMAQKLTNEQVVRPTDQPVSKTEALGRAVGDDCSDPFIIEVGDLPFTYTDTQESGTCGHGNTYDGEELGNWDDGEDVVYKIQTPQLTQANITLNGAESALGGFWHAVALYEGCPDTGTLIGTVHAGNGTSITLSRPLEANTEYFILIDSWGVSADPCLTAYDITIDFSADNIVYYYDLFVADEQVTSENTNDLSVIEGVAGSVVYDNDSKTLTLDNANITTDKYTIKNNGIEGLKINLIGDNIINCGKFLRHSKSTEIMGDGSLMATCSGDLGIYMNNAPLTIKNCSIEVAAQNWGIAGANILNDISLTVDNANLKVTGATGGSIKFITSLTLNNCVITAPAGAAFDADLYGVALDGEIVTEQVVIEPFSGIQDVEDMLGVSIYPNPAKDFVQINIEDAITNKLSLQVYDMLGKLIESQTITEQTTQLNIKNLEKGVYILKIGNSTKRFVIK